MPIKWVENAHLLRQSCQNALQARNPPPSRSSQSLTAVSSVLCRFLSISVRSNVISELIYSEYIMKKKETRTWFILFAFAYDSQGWGSRTKLPPGMSTACTRRKKRLSPSSPSFKCIHFDIENLKTSWQFSPKNSSYKHTQRRRCIRRSPLGYQTSSSLQLEKRDYEGK